MGDPPTYYEPTTTAQVSGPITLCINYNGISFNDESQLKLFHFEEGEEGPRWVDRTVSLDTTNNIICASVDSLLLFAVFESTTLPVAIDIKPGSFPNSINPRSKGVIPVAILTTDTFDATTVEPSTLLFGATGTEAAPVQSALKDVDGDGDIDMVLHFDTQAMGIQCGDTSVFLTAETFSGQMIQGSDSIKTAGCK
jgi:hypothetical protein